MTLFYILRAQGLRLNINKAGDVKQVFAEASITLIILKGMDRRYRGRIYSQLH